MFDWEFLVCATSLPRQRVGSTKDEAVGAVRNFRVGSERGHSWKKRERLSGRLIFLTSKDAKSASGIITSLGGRRLGLRLRGDA